MHRETAQTAPRGRGGIAVTVRNGIADASTSAIRIPCYLDDAGETLDTTVGGLLGRCDIPAAAGNRTENSNTSE